MEQWMQFSVFIFAAPILVCHANAYLEYLNPYFPRDGSYLQEYDLRLLEELQRLTAQYQTQQAYYPSGYGYQVQSQYDQYDPAYGVYGSSYPASFPDAMLNPYADYYQQPSRYDYNPYRVEKAAYEPYRTNVQHKAPSYQSRYKKPRKSTKLPKQEKKKMKIISIDRGFYVPGGTQAFGKYKSIKGCMKACAANPSCFAGDYNPWLGKCFFHSNHTACGTLKSHKKIVHFKKVPCSVPEAPRGLIILGAQLFLAIEQKGIDDLSTCIKKCASAGSGIPLTNADIAMQICFGVDYDFSTHKCYFHVKNDGNRICGATTDPIPTPRDLIANPSTVFIALCPALA
ncbi:hypothetical protein CAPTEDRAFT_228105 [Capitella teleta]|uniref:Apple domain-containing protein n=1 Tax=Capitella teleta TaxID=283909 RepID=R7TH45_CAPTE|nr:hypothetical protein CAPTEDRAFT_228105 [Capitella teleta]|eukprot:ELT90891.1 hypothetical protein CAPTEDRAFT_228105 [Capitella teleta]